MAKGAPEYPRLISVNCFRCGKTVDDDAGPDTCKRDEETFIQEARRDVHRWAAMRSIILYGEVTFTNWLRCLEIVGHVADESNWMSISPFITFLTERCKESGNKTYFNGRLGELERHTTEANRYFFKREHLMKKQTIEFTGHRSSAVID